jgi:predicted MPP superfamily phosphohydrolase
MMNLFFILYLLVYGGVHLYFFTKVKTAIPLNAGANGILIVLFLLMFFAPFLVRISEQQGLERLARFSAYAGYIWMGLIFIFFVASLAMDLYRLVVYAGHLASSTRFSWMKPSPMVALIFPLLVSLCVNAYGYFEAKNIRTERITIESEKIPARMGKLRIVQISDVHIGIIIREQYLEKIVTEIKKSAPDILVSTGDLMDGQLNNPLESMTLLKTIQPRYGKFAVTGNHEFYAGIGAAVDFMRKSGFTVLRDAAETIPGLINIAGIDDPTGQQMGVSKGIAEDRLLLQLPRDKFTLLLKHQPLVDVRATGLFDLQLSGHTHQGQIFPFSLITKLFFPNHAGYFDLPRQSRLYVSRGTGTWGPPVRFLAPPEITVIDLVHKKEKTL